MPSVCHRKTLVVVLNLVGLLAASCLHPQHHGAAVWRGRPQAAHADPPNRWTRLEWPQLDSPWRDCRFVVLLRPDEDRKKLRADVCFSATLRHGLSGAERHEFFEAGPKMDDLAVVLRLPNGSTVPAVEGWPDLSWTCTNPRFPSADAMYLLPWQGNDMEEGWIEVSLRGQRYWCNIPYGFLRDVTLRELPTSTAEGLADPKQIAGWSADTRLVNAAWVEYDLRRTDSPADPDAEWGGFVLRLAPGCPLRGSFRFRSKGAEPGLYSYTTRVGLCGIHGSQAVWAQSETTDDTASGYNGRNRGDGFVFPCGAGSPGRYWAEFAVELGPHRFSTALPSSLFRPPDG